MLAHTLKPILELVPEALPLIKQANVEADYPLDSRDNAIATALSLKYHECVDHKPIDVFMLDKVAEAIDLWGVKDQVSDLSQKMIKAAEQKTERDLFNRTKEERYFSKQANFEGSLTGFVDYVESAKSAEELYKQASELSVEPSDSVKRYSGHGMLDKKAAVESLAARFQATKNVDFVKIASAIGRFNGEITKPETVFDVCRTISQMDKEAGLSAKGFDFFREAVLVKEAEVASALRVKLCGKDVPYESIMRVGRDRIKQYVGEDVAKEMDAGPVNAKQVFETLPLDLQQLVVNLTKNV